MSSKSRIDWLPPSIAYVTGKNSQKLAYDYFAYGPYTSELTFENFVNPEWTGCPPQKHMCVYEYMNPFN